MRSAVIYAYIWAPITISTLRIRPPNITHAEDAKTVRQTALLSVPFPQWAISKYNGTNNARRTTPNQNGAASDPVVSSLSASLVPAKLEALSQIE